MIYSTSNLIFVAGLQNDVNERSLVPTIRGV